MGLELGLEVLNRNFLEMVDTGRVLERLVFFYKSNWKVMDPVA